MKWIKNHKKILIEIGIFLFFFVLSFVLRSFRSITSDEIWTFGFTYNIRRGLTIYKDYNVLQTPFYFLVGSLFLRFIGSYVMTIHLIDSVFMGILGVLLYRRISWKSFFVLSCVLLVSPSPYNFLCLFFLFLILFLLEQENDKDGWIAFLVGLIFMTKQNVGILLFFPMMFFLKKRGKNFLFFILPFSLISLYLLCKGALFDFLDDSFLGLVSFQEKNTSINPLFLIFELSVVFYLLYSLWKSRGKDKEAFFILAFQIMSYPIFDQGHFFVSFAPFLYYLTKNISFRPILYSLYTVTFLFCCCFYGVVCGEVHMERDILFLKAPDALALFMDELYSNFDGEVLNVYGNSEIPYLLKLYYDEPIGKFDMMLSGNLGSHEKETYQALNRHCKRVECTFLISKTYNDQFQEMTNYVKSNYIKVDEIQNVEIYRGFKN